MKIACVLYHHEFLTTGSSGDYGNGIMIECYNESEWNFLTEGNIPGDQVPTKYPQTRLQAISIPINQEMIGNNEISICHNVYYVVSSPEPEDWISPFALRQERYGCFQQRSTRRCSVHFQPKSK